MCLETKAEGCEDSSEKPELRLVKERVCGTLPRAPWLWGGESDLQQRQDEGQSPSTLPLTGSPQPPDPKRGRAERGTGTGAEGKIGSAARAVA